jgi:hypothetical protein
MSYVLIPDEKHGCVLLTCEGSIMLAEAMTAWREVQGLMAAMQWKRVLVDVTALRTNLDTEELFDLAKLLWRDFPQGGRMALVVRWDQSRLAKLLETLVRSVGMYLTVFLDEEPAGAWMWEETQDQQQVEELAQGELCAIN